MTNEPKQKTVPEWMRLACLPFLSLVATNLATDKEKLSEKYQLCPECDAILYDLEMHDVFLDIEKKTKRCYSFCHNCKTIFVEYL